MASRRHLTSVAEGVARAFAGRNNDVDGWWALGVLLAAVPADNPTVEIDLVSGETSPEFANEVSGLRLLPATWSGYFRWSVEHHGLSFGVVRAARLAVRFDLGDPRQSTFERDTYPFTCTVTIEDDRGHRRERSVEGRCFSHDPGVARQSGPGGHNRLHESPDRHQPESA